MTERDDYKQAISDAQSEGWGGAIMRAPRNICSETPLVAGLDYNIILEQIATSDGMPEPVNIR